MTDNRTQTAVTLAEIEAGRKAADAAWLRWSGGRSPLDGMEVFVRAALEAAAMVRNGKNG